MGGGHPRLSDSTVRGQESRAPPRAAPASQLQKVWRCQFII